MKAMHNVLDPRHQKKVTPGLCALAVMTKAPRAGQVKTRLTPPLTPEEAAALNSCFLRDTTSALDETVALGRARGIAVYTPAGTEDDYAEKLPTHFELVLQRGETLDVLDRQVRTGLDGSSGDQIARLVLVVILLKGIRQPF